MHLAIKLRVWWIYYPVNVGCLWSHSAQSFHRVSHKPKRGRISYSQTKYVGASKLSGSFWKNSALQQTRLLPGKIQRGLLVHQERSFRITWNHLNQLQQELVLLLYLLSLMAFFLSRFSMSKCYVHYQVLYFHQRIILELICVLCQKEIFPQVSRTCVLCRECIVLSLQLTIKVYGQLRSNQNFITHFVTEIEWKWNMTICVEIEKKIWAWIMNLYIHIFFGIRTRDSLRLFFSGSASGICAFGWQCGIWICRTCCPPLH